VQTAFAEELLFRGLIAGASLADSPSSGRTFASVHFPNATLADPVSHAGDVVRATSVFLGALYFWLDTDQVWFHPRLMLMHASGNITMALIVAVLTSV
jgi:membrane protease YdiL (CAAX protease family)